MPTSPTSPSTLTPSQISHLPTSKSDFNAVTHLQTYTANSRYIIPLLPSLLSWLQDPNWPIYPSVLSLLLFHKESVIPLVKDLLRPENNDDEDWKYWLVSDFVRRLERGEREGFREVLTAIEEAPTGVQRDVGLWGEVREVLRELDEGGEGQGEGDGDGVESRRGD